MRTVVMATLHTPAGEELAGWLRARGYEPLDVQEKPLLNEADVHALVSGAPVPDSGGHGALDLAARGGPGAPDPALVLATSRAIMLDPVLTGGTSGNPLDAMFPRSRLLRILESIPPSPDRVQAILTVRFLVHYVRPTSGADVWGLVCVEGVRVRVRWRHGSAADLEDATERFLEDCRQDCRPGGLFSAVHDEVPVKEDGGLEPAYTGRYLSIAAKRERARKDKQLELLMTRVAVWIVSLSAAGGFALSWTHPNEHLRWLTAWVGSIGTGALVTMVTSYLNYRLHLGELMNKPVMDWRR